ncbi:MAG: peptidoglycan-binding protein [Roseibium sp.]
MRMSDQGLKFLAEHEGFVSRGYLDPVGVVTIAYGFTMRSRVFAAWWRAKHGRKLKVNDRMTRTEADQVLQKLLSEEFEPSVHARMPSNTKQHQFDAATSAVYNLGPAFMGWKAAKLWIAGKIKAAASYWATHYNTAAGRKLPGLVRRRKEEAHLFLTGDYGGAGVGIRDGVVLYPRQIKPIEPDPVVREAQEALKRFGFDPGSVDGWMGRNTKTAVLAYQKNHPHLSNDGIIGPATMAQLRKDGLAVKDSVMGGGGVAGAGFLSVLGGLPWGWIIAAGLVLVALWLGIRYRDVIMRRFNQCLKLEVS